MTIRLEPARDPHGEELVQRALAYAQAEHEKIMALLRPTASRGGGTPAPNSLPTGAATLMSTPLTSASTRTMTATPMLPAPTTANVRRTATTTTAPSTGSTTLQSMPPPPPNTSTSTLAAIAKLAPTHNAVSSTHIYCRIYVGSVQFDIGEADITTLFSQFGPLKRVDMMPDPLHRRHRGFGFLEFETPEAAALALTIMDGVELGGRAIKVGRPNNFPAEMAPGLPRPIPARLYVANLHALVAEEEVDTLFGAFGSLRFCHLAPDGAGGHRGYGYVEFEEEAAAEAAYAALQNFELAKRILRVGRSIIGGPPPPGMRSAAGPAASADTDTTEASPGASKEDVQAEVTGPAAVENGKSAPETLLPEAAKRAAEQINASLSGRVMALRNLEDYDRLRENPAAIGELEADVREECVGRFGPVLSCRVHLDHQQRTVTVYVRFAQPGTLEEALRLMHMRWFGGRQIIAEAHEE